MATDAMASAGAGQGGETDHEAATPPRIPIASIAERDQLQRQVCRVEGVRSRTSSKNGNPFLVGQLTDASGRVDFIAFDLPRPTMEAVRSASLVRVTGDAAEFNGRLQLKVHRFDPVDGDLEPAEFELLFPTTDRDVDAMMADLRDRLLAIEDVAVRAIARDYLDDAAVMTRFRSAPAATSNHHAWIGGLLEHTWEMMRMASAILDGEASGRIAAPLFPDLDRDLVVLGIFLHDLAKTEELEWDGAFGYSRRGNLVGHLVGGAIELDRRARDLRDEAGAPITVRPAVLDTLTHMLVSHHGRLEHGSAKLPATPEAVFLAHLDDLAAKTATVIGVAARGDASGHAEFSELHWALETRVYRPNPLDDSDPAD